MVERITQALSWMRPRTIARLGSQVQQLHLKHSALAERLGQDTRDAREAAARAARDAEARTTDIARQLEDLTRQLEAVTGQLARLNSAVDAQSEKSDARWRQLDTVALKCDQLAVAAERLSTGLDVAPALARATESGRVRTHVAAAIRGAELNLSPFPYMVIDNFLPRDVYGTLIKCMPPRVLFEDKPVNRQQMRVPPTTAGAACYELWRFLVQDIVAGEIQPALLERFREPVREFAHRFWPGLDMNTIRFASSDGRIILRRRGYAIPPHRDPKWGWLTVILYLARPGDPDTWGTQLYHVTDDTEAPGAQPFWMQGRNNVLVRDVPFVPNRALIFLNSDGSHGASLPDEAPAEFERYIYQCRVGPDQTTIEQLMALLPADARVKWEGKERY